MSAPLAERLRPQNLDQFIGQKHLVGKGAVLRRMIDSGRIPSIIFWGPPGGKDHPGQYHIEYTEGAQAECHQLGGT